MERQRLTGLMLIGAAAVMVMAISALQGRPVAGTAVAQPVPPRPQVGDCSTVEMTQQRWDEFNTGVLPVLTSQPCQGVQAGEVIQRPGHRASRLTLPPSRARPHCRVPSPPAPPTTR